MLTLISIEKIIMDLEEKIKYFYKNFIIRIKITYFFIKQKILKFEFSKDFLKFYQYYTNNINNIKKNDNIIYFIFKCFKNNIYFFYSFYIFLKREFF